MLNSYKTGSVDELAHTSRLHFDTQRLAELQVPPPRACGLAYMQGMPAGLLKDRRDPNLATKLPARGWSADQGWITFLWYYVATAVPGHQQSMTYRSFGGIQGES